MTLHGAVLSLWVAIGAAAGAPPAVAVLDVEVGADLGALDVAALDDAFARGLADPEAWRLLALRDIRAMLSLERQKELLGACRGESCLAALGEGLDAPWVVLASIRRSDGRLVATGRILSRESGAALDQVTEAGTPADAGELLRKLGLAVRSAWRRSRGLAPSVEVACGGAADCDTACRGGNGVACARLGDALASASRDLARAGAAWARACELGAEETCLRGAAALDAGGFRSAALPAYRRACAEGSAAACARGGELLVLGERDPQAGTALLGQGCQAGHAEACLKLGTFLDEGGHGVPRDAGRAATWLAAACEAGSAEGCARLAASLLSGGRTHRERAVALLRRGCALETPSCTVTLETFGRLGCANGQGGECVELGLEVLGGTSDPELGSSLLREGCRARADACRSRAATELASNDARRAPGLRLAEVACGAGSAAACRDAVRVLRRGSDQTRRLDLLTTACERGDPEACQEAGEQVEAGGPTQDLARAARLHEKGCGLGCARCCLDLAELYRDGRVPPPDATAARRARLRACQAGLVEACPNSMNP